MIITSIADGVSSGIGCCSIVVRPVDDEDNSKEYESMYVKCSKGIDPEFAELELIATGMVKFENAIVVLGRLGQIIFISEEMILQEQIQGPENYGFLVDIQVIGDSIYAVGMCRQVYMSSNGKTWVRCDDGVLDKSLQLGRITGFRAIDGLSSDDLYAVGLEGEIWNYRSNIWRKEESPTNVTLEKVRVINSNEAYVVGQAGIILRGNGRTWEVIEQTETTDDFWTLEWFNNTLYLATATNLYTLNAKGGLNLFNPVREGPDCFSCLRASHGVLWSFGPEKVYWTVDGSIWEEFVIFKHIN